MYPLFSLRCRPLRPPVFQGSECSSEPGFRFTLLTGWDSRACGEERCNNAFRLLHLGIAVLDVSECVFFRSSRAELWKPNAMLVLVTCGCGGSRSCGGEETMIMLLVLFSSFVRWFRIYGVRTSYYLTTILPRRFSIASIPARRLASNSAVNSMSSQRRSSFTIKRMNDRSLAIVSWPGMRAKTLSIEYQSYVVLRLLHRWRRVVITLACDFGFLGIVHSASLRPKSKWRAVLGLFSAPQLQGGAKRQILREQFI